MYLNQNEICRLSPFPVRILSEELTAEELLKIGMLLQKISPHCSMPPHYAAPRTHMTKLGCFLQSHLNTQIISEYFQPSLDAAFVKRRPSVPSDPGSNLVGNFPF